MKESPIKAPVYKLCNCCMHHFEDLSNEDLCRQCDTYAQKKYQEGELDGQEKLLNRLRDTKDLNEMRSDYWLSTTRLARDRAGLESQLGKEER